MKKISGLAVLLGIVYPVLSFSQDVPVQMEQTRRLMTLKEKLESLKAVYGVSLVYDSALSLDRPYTGGNIAGLGLEDALDKILKDTGIVWKKQRKYIILSAGSAPEIKDTLRYGVPVTGSVEERADTITESYVAADLFRRNSTQTGLTRISASQFNQGFAFMSTPDLIKTIQTLPGVSSGSELLSGLYVHGGTGTDNLFLLDGVPIYQVSHFAGLFSSFNTDVVESLDFYKSGFPARYGGRMSSVVDVSTRDGDMEDYHGVFSIGLIDGRFQVEGPIARNRTSFNIAMRRSWVDLFMIPAAAIMNRNSPEDRQSTAYSFYDINAKITHRFSVGNTLSFNVYNGRDGLKLTKTTWSDYLDSKGEHLEDNSSSRFRWGNLMTSLDWDYRFSRTMKSRVILYYTLSHGYTDALLSNWSGNSIRLDLMQKSKSKVNDYGLRADLEWVPSYRHYIRYGASYLYHTYLPSREYSRTVVSSEETSDVGRIAKDYHGHEASVYAEDEISVSKWFKMNLGMRYALFGTPGKVWHGIEPRAAFRFQISPAVSTRLSYTRMHQFNHNIASTYIDLPTNIWMPSTAVHRPMDSHQIAAGLYVTLPYNMHFNLEGFGKTMDHILEYSGINSLYPPVDSWERSFVQGKGRAYGAEVELGYRTERTGISAYYTLSWSERRFEDFYPEWYPDRNDNRHKFTLMASHRFGKGIELYMAWNYHSGNRMTVPDQVIESERTTITGTETVRQLIYSRPNNALLPDYHRLDVGMNIRKKTRKGNESIWNVSIYNVYCRMNAVFVSIDSNDSSLKAKATGIFPILPSFSYTYRF